MMEIQTQLQRFISHGKALFEARDFEVAHQEFSYALHLLEEADGSRWLEAEEIAEIYLLRGSALFHDDERLAYQDPDVFHQVLEDFEMAIEAQPDNYVYRTLRGRLFLNCKYANYLREAKEDFAKALSLQPDDVQAQKQMGDVLSKLGEFDRAIYYFSQVLNKETDKETYLLRGVSHFRKFPPDFAAAAADFGQAQKWLPRLEELYLWRAKCFQELGEMAVAIEEYDRLLAFSTQKAGYYVDRGVMRLDTDPEGALADYNQALALGANPLAYNNRAFYYRQKGEFDKAIADAQAALAVDPNFAIAYATLAEIYADLGDRESLYEYLELAVTHYYEDALALMEETAFIPYQEEERFRALLLR
jgi:tetratricopeptide (TPR) repeat protein